MLLGMVADQFFHHGDQRQEVLFNCEVEGVFLLQVDGNYHSGKVNILCP